MTQEGLVLFKFSMLILPLILILIGYVVYAKKYTINEITYQEILKKLKEKKDAK
jgi:melibiose permease/lactose/raffinose/galactose permease